jgi:hypothetical protein
MALGFIEYYLSSVTLFLAINTYKDIKKKEIDSRLNYLAFGATLMILAYFQPSLLAWVIPLLVTTLTVLFFSWKKFLASGDTEAISWMMFALGLFDYWRMVVFLILLTASYCFNFIVKKLSKDPMDKAPGYPLLLSSWLISLLTFFFW